MISIIIFPIGIIELVVRAARSRFSANNNQRTIPTNPLAEHLITDRNGTTPTHSEQATQHAALVLSPPPQPGIPPKVQAAIDKTDSELATQHAALVLSQPQRVQASVDKFDIDRNSFSSCPEDIKRDVALALARHDPSHFPQYLAEFKGDREVIRILSKGNSLAINFASKELKNDKVFVISLLDQACPNLIEGFPERARNIFCYAGKTLLQDEEFVRLAMSKYNITETEVFLGGAKMPRNP
ncbi:MAG: DUF4116 domain-containing protein [Chlamydiae bacterium]|nr:DUF4116 domain-containing protein [Chlamydiota bacterium]